MNKVKGVKLRHLFSFIVVAFITVTLGNIFVTEANANPQTVPDIVRFEGDNRAEVAESVAKAHFSNSDKAIIVNQDKFTDAISATNISQGRYPVLYTRAGKVSPSTVKLLKSMPLNEIYILGGKNSISDSVISHLQRETGVQITRIDGINRYDANVTSVETNFSQSNHVVLASGEVYPDALYGVSYANKLNAPVILTNTNFLETETVELLKELNVDKATIIGGANTVTTEVENQLRDLGINNDRIAGENRYAGSVEVANASYTNPENIVVASGEVFTDALVSAPLAQKLEAPILLVRANRMSKRVDNYLKQTENSTENIYIHGGPTTISHELFDRDGTQYHLVNKGDTVYSIGNYYTMSENNLTRWNNLSNNTVKLGQILSLNGKNIYSDIVKEKNTFTSTDEFIKHISPIALEVAGEYELYPSVMIAQSVLETGSGASELATLANNYFGIKGSYEGNSLYKLSPEEINGKFDSVRSQFRMYPTLYASFEDNGKRLRLGPNTDSNSASWSPGHYKGTWVENTESYEDATQALVDAGYATDSNYSKKLNNIIEDYNLTQYDDKLYKEN